MMTTLERRAPWAPWAGLYLFVWAGAVAMLVAIDGLEAAAPALIIGGLFAGLLPGVVWLLTRKSDPITVPVARPAVEMAGVGGWLLIYAIVCLGWLFTVIKQAVPPGTQEFKLVMLAVKLAIHVAIPLLILKLLGAKLGPLFKVRWGQRGVLALFVIVGGLSIGINILLSPWLTHLMALNPTASVLAWAAPGAFLWMALEAGLCEEVLFRAILQSRLAAVLRSEAGAAVIAALVFGLAHAPGLFLRPDTGGDAIAGGLPGILAYTVGVLSPIGLTYGVIWARTRNLWLLVALHATVDFLPNLADFIKVWG